MNADAMLAVAAAVALAATGWGLYLVRGSTAVPAAAWGVAAAAAFLGEAVGRARGQLEDPATAAVVRLAVAALVVCPAMSLLGAKRPQHGVWQFIVGTLAFVLALPAVSAVLVRPGSMPDVHLLERGFFAVLVGVGWMNFVGTRHGVAATLASAGMAGLVRDFLPGGDPGQEGGGGLDLVAAALVAVGAVLAAWQSTRSPAQNPGLVGLAAAIDRPFLALRETFGAAWTLRIAERFNAVAAERSWPCRLQFSGVALDTGRNSPAAWEREANRCFRALARRFVSEAWLARHGPAFPAEVRTSPTSKTH